MRDLTTRRWVVSELWLTSYKTWDVSDTLSSVDDIQFISAMYCQSYGCFILDHGHPISFSCISVLIYASVTSSYDHHVLVPVIFSCLLCTRHVLALIMYSYPSCTCAHHLYSYHHLYSCPPCTRAHHVLVFIMYSYSSRTRTHHVLVGPAGGGAASSSAVDLQQLVVRRRRRR